MKCIIKGENNKSVNETVIVRRKFVPIKFLIERGNQFLNAGAKLPFATSKVNALLVTSKVDNPCVDEGLPPKFYYGISDSQMTDTRFLDINEGAFYNDSYPPDGFTDGLFENSWWYYVHPILDRFPVLLQNGSFERLTNPIALEFKQAGQCTADRYYLWSGRLPNEGLGFSLVTFNPPN